MSRDAVLQQRIERKNCFQLMISLVFKKNAIVLHPSPHEFINGIVELLESDLKSLTNIKCILFSKLEAVHSDTDGSQVFLTDDPYPRDQISTIQSLYRAIFQVPISLEKAANAFTSLMTEDGKSFKKQWSKPDLTVADYSNKIEEFNRKRKEIETLLFEDELLLGPFSVEVGKLRSKLLKKLDDLTKVLYDCVNKKVMDQSKELEDCVDEVLEVVNKQEWANIEEVDKTRRFIIKIQDKYDFLNSIKRAIVQKTDFLDANWSRMTEEDIEKMWTAFAKPQEIMYV